MLCIPRSRSLSTALFALRSAAWTHRCRLRHFVRHPFHRHALWHHLALQAQKPWAKLLEKVNKAKSDYHTACKNERSAINQERNATGDTSLSPDQVSVSHHFAHCTRGGLLSLFLHLSRSLSCVCAHARCARRAGRLCCMLLAANALEVRITHVARTQQHCSTIVDSSTHCRARVTHYSYLLRRRDGICERQSDDTSAILLYLLHYSRR